MKKICSAIISLLYPLLLITVICMVIDTPRNQTVTFRTNPHATLPAYTVDMKKNTISRKSTYDDSCRYIWYQIGPYYRAQFIKNFSVVDQSPKSVIEQWSHEQPPSNYTSINKHFPDRAPTWAHMAEMLTYFQTELLPARGLRHPIMPVLIWSLCITSLLLGTWMILSPKSAVSYLIWYRKSVHSSDILPHLFRYAGGLLLICAALLLHFLVFIFI